MILFDQSKFLVIIIGYKKAPLKLARNAINHTQMMMIVLTRMMIKMIIMITMIIMKITSSDPGKEFD